MPTSPANQAWRVWADFAGTQVLPNIRSFHVKRGRQDELSAIQTGEMTIVLGNPNGDLSPDNASGAYYPYVRLGARIELFYYDLVTNAPSPLYVYLFVGFIESITPLDNTVIDSDVVIVAKDLFKQLTLAKLTASLAAQDEAARINAVLTAALPTYYLPTTVLDPGLETILASTLNQTPALQHIQDVCAGERGYCFIAANGYFVYHNRHHRYVNATGYTSQATFGQASGYPFVAMEYVYDDQLLYNDVQVNASGTSEGVQTASDATSQDDYGVRTLAITSATMPAGHAATLATWLLYCYKDPRGRVKSLTVHEDVESTGAVRYAQLNFDLGYRITVIRNNPGSLGISRPMWIEGIEHSYDAESSCLHTTWLLTDIGVGGPTPFRLGLSALNSGDVLIY